MIAKFQPRTETTGPLASEGTFYLGRLSRLIKLLPSPTAGFDAGHLLRHAIFSTYVDCREHGMEEQARQTLLEAMIERRSPSD